jgi:hypothetical protein
MYKLVNPVAGEPLTGEPDAGDPPVRFGGRGCRIHSALPTPIMKNCSSFSLDMRSLHALAAEFTLALFKRRIPLFELPASINEGQDCNADVKIAVLDVEKCKHQKQQRDEERC